MISSIQHTILLIPLNLNVTNSHLVAPSPHFSLCIFTANPLKTVVCPNSPLPLLPFLPDLDLFPDLPTMLPPSFSPFTVPSQSLRDSFPKYELPHCSLNGKTFSDNLIKACAPKGLQTVLTLFYILTSLVYTFLYTYVSGRAKLPQSCLSLCDPLDYNPPGVSVHGTLQTRIPEWVAMPSSRGSSRPRGRTHVSFVSCFGRQEFFATSATWEALICLCPLSKYKQEWFCSLLDFQCLKVLGMESVSISICWIYEWMREREREGLSKELQAIWDSELSYEQKAGISAMDRVWVNSEQMKSTADNRDQRRGKARETVESLAWLAGQGMLGTDRRSQRKQ